MAPILTRLGQSFGFGASAGGGAPPSPIQATGGDITDPFPGGDGKTYKAHIFKSGGNFVISKLSTSDKPSDINWTVVGGSGGGGCNRGGGGAGGGSGAGGVMTDMPFAPAPRRNAQGDVTWAAGTWLCSIGGGGQGRPGNQQANGGGNSSFYQQGTPTNGITAYGGGRGGSEGQPGYSGGCGGGGCAGPSGSSGGGGRSYPAPSSPNPIPAPAGMGEPGSPAASNDNGSGGGGGALEEGNRPHGGKGVQLLGMICSPTSPISGAPVPVGSDGPPSIPTAPYGGFVAGGGGGGYEGRGGNPGGGGPGNLRYSGAGSGPSGEGAPRACVQGSGGGAAGGGGPDANRNGATGIIIFRYEVDA